MWKIDSCSLSRYVTKQDPSGIQGRQRIDEGTDDPTWDTVEAYFAMLDGHACSEMSLDGPKGRGMTLGGGPDRYCVSTIGDDFGPYDLQGPDLSDEPALIILGGVQSFLPRRFHSTRDHAIQAARYFYDHGDVDPRLDWHLC